jgi:hypothetical protein
MSGFYRIIIKFIMGKRQWSSAKADTLLDGLSVRVYFVCFFTCHELSPWIGPILNELRRSESFRHIVGLLHEGMVHRKADIHKATKSSIKDKWDKRDEDLDLYLQLIYIETLEEYKFAKNAIGKYLLT